MNDTSNTTTEPVVATAAEPDLLTVKETADFLRTTSASVYQMVSRGQIPGVVHVGRRVLVRRKDLRGMVGLLPSEEGKAA